MSDIKPRWGRINAKVVVGMENMLIQQHLHILQAMTTVEALKEMQCEMAPLDGEDDSVFESRKTRMETTIQTAETDLDLKEKIEENLTKEYKELIENAPNGELDALKEDDKE